jgi:hypothetical protein
MEALVGAAVVEDPVLEAVFVEVAASAEEGVRAARRDASRLRLSQLRRASLWAAAISSKIWVGSTASARGIPRLMQYRVSLATLGTDVDVVLPLLAAVPPAPLVATVWTNPTATKICSTSASANADAKLMAAAALLLAAAFAAAAAAGPATGAGGAIPAAGWVDGSIPGAADGCAPAAAWFVPVAVVPVPAAAEAAAFVVVAVTDDAAAVVAAAVAEGTDDMDARRGGKLYSICPNVRGPYSESSASTSLVICSMAADSTP